VLFPDAKSIWKGEIGYLHVGTFHDAYIDYVREQKKPDTSGSHL
jgi:hypothetical protein